jgi:hypothetical protein
MSLCLLKGEQSSIRTVKPIRFKPRCLTSRLIFLFEEPGLAVRISHLLSSPVLFQSVGAIVPCPLALGPYVRCQTDLEWSLLRQEVNKIR